MNKVLMAMALSAALVATPAFAQPYVGAGIGNSKTDVSKTSYKLFIGLHYNQNLGYEVAYNNFAGYPGARADSWSLAAIGSLPLDNSWDILGKLGVTENHTKFVDSSRHLDLLVGIGIGYNVTKDIGVRLEYEDFGRIPSAPNTVSATVTNWGINVKISFR